MNRPIFAAFAAAFVLFAGSAGAQTAPNFDAVQIKTFDLGHHTYMLEGQGGNITVAVGTDGVIMVDGEFAPLHDKIKAAIAAVTNEPIRYLINTHFHGDHTGGNAPFTADGATVVAHVNVRTRLAAGTTNGLTGAKTPPAVPAALPVKVYTDFTTLQVKGVTARIGHIANAHTDGDSYVYFPEANVLSTGDVATLVRYPNVDFANGGNIAGMIAGIDTYLTLINDDTKIVPGHGELGHKADLVRYRAMLIDARDRIAALIAKGMTEQQAVAAKPFADLDVKQGADAQASSNFVRVIYHSLADKT